MSEERTEAFKSLLKRTKNAKDLDNALSSMDASSKYGPLLLQSMKLTGRENAVKQYEENFRKTEED
jgi:hypothetical protein